MWVACIIGFLRMPLLFNTLTGHALRFGYTYARAYPATSLQASCGSHISGVFCNTHSERCTYADKAYIVACIVEPVYKTIAVVALSVFHFV